MAGRAQTRETYDLMLAAFRDQPAGYTNAARVAGVDRATAKRVWSAGWPKLQLPPIQETVEAERNVARAASMNARREVIESQAAERTKKLVARFEQEANSVAVQWGNVAMMVASFRQYGSALWTSIEKTLKAAEAANKDPFEGIALRERAHLLTELGRAVRALTIPLETGVELNRKLLGDPVVVLPAPDQVGVEERTPEQLAAESRKLAAEATRLSSYLSEGPPPGTKPS